MMKPSSSSTHTQVMVNKPSADELALMMSKSKKGKKGKKGKSKK